MHRLAISLSIFIALVPFLGLRPASAATGISDDLHSTTHAGDSLQLTFTGTGI